MFTIPSTLAPSPPDAGRYAVPSRFKRQSYDCGFIVRVASARFVTSPHLTPRVLLMEQQVWSRPDNYSCDLVSQRLWKNTCMLYI